MHAAALQSAQAATARGWIPPRVAESSDLSDLDPDGGKQLGEDDPATGRSVLALLDRRGPVLLSGRPGSGKSTAVRLLQAAAARRGIVVVTASAEGYVPGRVDDLVAGAAAVLVNQ